MKLMHPSVPLAFLAAMWGFPLVSQAAFPPLALQPVSVGELQAPVAIATPQDGSGRLFLCEQGGLVRILQNGKLLPRPFLDVSSRMIALTPAYDERGLLGMAFHPGYTNPGSAGFGRFYVFYSAPSTNAPGTTNQPVDCQSVISEFQVSTNNPNLADPGSERIVLSFDKPQANHNGGQLDFGPDGFLYIGTGDGGSEFDNDAGHTSGDPSQPSGVLGNAQDTTRLLGKILRIDPLGTNAPGGQYGIPDSNPFVGQTNGTLPEIYAFGLRNPWRFSFDTGPGGTGRLFAADVGQDSLEEVDLITSGGNYGWRVMEGTNTFDPAAPNGGLPLLAPIAQYAHPGVNLGPPQLGIAVIGGYVYRGSAIPPLNGKYIFGDWTTLESFAPSGLLLGLEETSSNQFALSVLQIVGGNPFPAHLITFGRDEQGELYLATRLTAGPANDPNSGLPTGGLYKLVPAQTSNASLSPGKDNTIFSESGTLSDALGPLVAGQTDATNGGPYLRRALLAFDVAGQLPAGALITSAQLNLNLTTVGPVGPGGFALYPVLEDWGEGTSSNPAGDATAATTNDATWTQRFYRDTSWTSQGGSFAPNASATTTLGMLLGAYTWESDRLAADVQAWLDYPATNFGWILLGDETMTSVRVFDSRETTNGIPPQLQLSYATANPVATFTALDILTNGQFQLNFLGTVGSSWTVLASSDLSLPSSAWTVLGPANQIALGQFQFTAESVHNFPLRFYRLRSP